MSAMSAILTGEASGHKPATQELRTCLGGVFAVLPTPCDDWGLVEVGVEASPDKWGRLRRLVNL